MAVPTGDNFEQYLERFSLEWRSEDEAEQQGRAGPNCDTHRRPIRLQPALSPVRYLLRRMRQVVSFSPNRREHAGSPTSWCRIAYRSRSCVADRLERVYWFRLLTLRLKTRPPA